MKLVDQIYRELQKDEDFQRMGMDQQGEMAVKLAKEIELEDTKAEYTNELDDAVFEDEKPMTIANVKRVDEVIGRMFGCGNHDHEALEGLS